MDNETIAQNILNFLAQVTEEMNDEQTTLFISGYCFGLAIGDPELFEEVETLARWENLIAEG